MLARLSAFLRRENYARGKELQERADLIRLGWDASTRETLEREAARRLPPCADVLLNQKYWAARGVVVPEANFFSEQAALGPVPRVGPRRMGAGTKADVEAPSDLQPTRPPSEEIFERHGWDRFESGWLPLF